MKRGGGAMFPTGQLVDQLDVPGIGTFAATMINAGIPTIFVNAAELGYHGTELQDVINGDAKALDKFETIRAYGAVKMGLISELSEAKSRQHTPENCFCGATSSISVVQWQSHQPTRYRFIRCGHCRWANCITR